MERNLRDRKAERREQSRIAKQENSARRIANLAIAIAWVGNVWHDYRYPDRGTIFKYRASQKQKRNTP